MWNVSYAVENVASSCVAGCPTYCMFDMFRNDEKNKFLSLILLPIVKMFYKTFYWKHFATKTMLVCNTDTVVLHSSDLKWVFMVSYCKGTQQTSSGTAHVLIQLPSSSYAHISYLVTVAGLQLSDRTLNILFLVQDKMMYFKWYDAFGVLVSILMTADFEGWQGDLHWPKCRAAVSDTRSVNDRGPLLRAGRHWLTNL